MMGMAGAALAPLLWRELRAHAGRHLVSVLAIAIGVAMGYAVHLINHAALGEFSAAVRALMGNADVEIRGPRDGFDESVYPRVAALPMVRAVSPVAEVDAHLVRPAVRGEPEAALKILGLDVFRAAAVQPSLVGRPAPEEGRLATLDPEAVFLSPAALAWLDLKPGEHLELQAGLETVSLRIAGSLPLAGEGIRLGVMDIAAVQERFQRLGRLQRLAVRLAPGTDPQVFAAAVAPLLPAGVRVGDPEDQARRTANLSRAYRANLNVLALVALFTGAFMVFTSQALAVLRRRAQLALLRVLGVTRSGVLGLVLAEGLILGLAGAVLGLALGYGLAAGFLARFGGDLGGGYFQGVRPTAMFEPGAAGLFLFLGLAATLAGSLAPAWEAARAAPARALKAGDEETPLGRLATPWPGLALLLLGGLLTVPGPVNGLPVFGYLAIAALLLGGILLMPGLAGGLFARLPTLWRPLPHLALAQLAAAPGRAAIALAGILASFTLMVAMAVMVASFRDSVDRWLVHVLPADLYLRAATAGDSGYLSSAVQSAIRSAPGVVRAEFQLATQIDLDPARPPITLIARDLDPANPGGRLALVGAPLTPDPGDPVPVWASEAMVDLYGYRVGHRTLLPLAGRGVPVRVAGVWRDYARQHGALVMTAADYGRLTGDHRVNDAALWLEPGTGPAQAAERLRTALPGAERLTFATPGEIRAVSLTIFDRSFAVTYLLEGVAMVIGLMGIGAAFSGQALARTREFGMLRHLGMTRRQIGGLLAVEGGLITVLGCLAGLALGLGIAQVLIRVVNPQSFHWRMDLAVPWDLLAGVAVVLVACAALTALLSGRRAMSGAAVRAVREDW